MEAIGKVLGEVTGDSYCGLIVGGLEAPPHQLIIFMLSSGGEGSFESPVPVGSVLYLTAAIAYTDPPLVSLLDQSARSKTEVEETASNKCIRV